MSVCRSSICLSVCVSSVCLSVDLFICLSTSVCLSLCVSYIYICLPSVWLSVCLPVCLWLSQTLPRGEILQTRNTYALTRRDTHTHSHTHSHTYAHTHTLTVTHTHTIADFLLFIAVCCCSGPVKHQLINFKQFSPVSLGQTSTLSLPLGVSC